MYIGIDLGTSNSAIVGKDENSVRLFKTDDGRDVLPSLIYVDRRGHMLVGSRAHAQAELSPDKVAQGFKRLMGTASIIELAGADKTFTPEEASAEVIKTLLRQAEVEVGSFLASGTIITIPAAFNQMQSEATIKAAHMAGLERVGLLQEPIAAAMASLEGAAQQDGLFLVYDLGGGTFDVALVEARVGSVTVIAHEGINLLGGRDFDRAIVDAVIKPWLSQHFQLPAAAATLPAYNRLFKLARLKAEQAKIELSTKPESVIFISDEEARAEDLDGEPIYVECTLKREQMEGLIRHSIDDSIELCRKILKDNNLTHDDVGRLVLIGGPSKMPIVREYVSSSLGIPVDLRCDPMTAVARGAAIFAESREWTDTKSSRKSARGSKTVEGDIGLRVDYTARGSDQRARVRLRTAASGDGWKVRITGPSGYDSGFAPFDGDDIVTVPLDIMGENGFEIELVGGDGRRLCDVQQILITRTEATATAIPATRTVAVKAAAGPAAERRNMLVPLVKKGTPLPAAGVETFRLREAMVGGNEGQFSVELFNMAEGVEDPLLNLPIGVFQIDTSELDLSPGQKLPSGTTINIPWSMDDNGLIACTIEIPDFGLRFEQKNFYVPEAGHRNFDGDDGGTLARANLSEAKQALTETKEALEHKTGAEFATLSRRLDRMEELLDNSTDAEARRAATEEALHIQQELARLREAPENRRAVMLRDLQSFEDGIAEHVDSLDRPTVERLSQLSQSARESIGNEDWSKARQIIEQMNTVYYKALYELPDFIVGLFLSIAPERHAALDKLLHDEIVARGMACVDVQDIDGVRVAIRDLLRNRMPSQVGASKVAFLADIMR